MLICFHLVVLALFFLSIATNSTHHTVNLENIVLVVCLMASHFRNTKLALVEYSPSTDLHFSVNEPLDQCNNEYCASRSTC
jgi:hypothetical protein